MSKTISGVPEVIYLLSKENSRVVKAEQLNLWFRRRFPGMPSVAHNVFEIATRELDEKQIKTLKKEGWQVNLFKSTDDNGAINFKALYTALDCQEIKMAMEYD